MWTKVKKSTDLKKQAETRARNIRQQSQFNSTSKYRQTAPAAEIADGEYVDCKTHAKNIEKKTRKSLTQNKTK